MRRLRYSAAVAALAALLLIVSAPVGMAAEPSGQTGTSMGAPQYMGGPSGGGGPSQGPQGSASDPRLMGGGVQGQGGYPGSGERKSSGFDQPATTGERGPGGAGERGAATKMSAAGEGTVISIDQPDNCLRIREGPTTASRQVGCAKMGDRLPLSGQFSRDSRWAQLTDTGWVFVCQIRTDLKPPGGPVACGRGGGSYEMWSGPAGYYREDFGGPTYFYGGYGPGWYGHKWHDGHHGHHGHHGKHGGHHKK